MKKNDKLIVLLGVIILVAASIGVYYWVPEETTLESAQIEDFFSIAGVMNDMPEAIAVSDSCPFYALIATPLAVNYNSEGEQNVIPLYIKNFEDPSRAIVRAEELIDLTIDEMIKDSISAKNASLEFAKKYWESSEGVLIIENTQSGYNLGVLATPFASYLSIPVIVTDEIDVDVRDVLNDLGVKCSIVCGDIDGFGDVLRFNNADDIVNASIEIVREKFGEINYITVTNPIDAREPEVLDSINLSFDGTVTGFSLLPSQIVPTFKNINTAAGKHLGDFTIPGDYKYALVKFKGIGKYKDGENPDEFGSAVAFTVSGPAEIFGSGLGTSSGIPIRDANGNIEIDQVYSETVVYDMGGEEFSVSGKANLFVSDSAQVTVNIVIEKLSDPLYPMMKKLSAVAPYLTAYRGGIILGKPEFAFVADDDVRTQRDETCPGFYLPRMNHKLQYPSNKHVFWIHDQINELLAKLADIDISGLGALEDMRDHYETNPVYIALVGGNVVLPQIIYDSYLCPPGDGYISLKYGIGMPSDVIYGNIDPIRDDWSMTVKDVYGEFPIQENIVGRITGWDVQDASALVTRTVFYNNIIGELGTWKDKATVQSGCGTDFLKPWVASFIRKAMGKDPIVKWPSGQSDIGGDALQKTVLEPLGFDVYRTKHTASQVKGFSDAAIEKIRKTGILSRLLFAPNLVRLITGEKHVKGGQYMEECNIIWQNAHGWPNGYEAGDVMTNSLGYRPGLNGIINWLSRTGIVAFLNTGMTNYGNYDPRNIEHLELGPSVMIIESCFTGKIDGMYPQQAVSQAPLHAGVNALVASPTETNVPGGYLEPYLEKGIKWDRYNIIGNIVTRMNIRNDIYPEPHFGPLIYRDFYRELGKDKDVGTALRNARNEYLPQDIDSTFKWVPPLELDDDIRSTGGGSGGANLAPNVPEHKYLAYYDYVLYGDPAFNPYMPNE